MKIFVTVGGGLQPFDRLLAAVDALQASSKIAFEGVCQVGPSRIEPRGMKSVRQVSRPDFDRHVADADVIVCHAGVGTLATAIRHGHVPVAMARRAAFGEVVNDHQVEMVRQLAATGQVLDADQGLTAELLVRAREARRPSRNEPPVSTSDFVEIAKALRPKARAMPGGGFALRVLASLTRFPDRLR